MAWRRLLLFLVRWLREMALTPQPTQTQTPLPRWYEGGARLISISMEVGTPESIQDVVSVSGSVSGNAADDGDGDEPDPPEELERYL